MIEELLKAASLLKTVPVTGDYWMIMQACVNSIMNVANQIKAQQAVCSNVAAEKEAKKE